MLKTRNDGVPPPAMLGYKTVGLSAGFIILSVDGLQTKAKGGFSINKKYWNVLVVQSDIFVAGEFCALIKTSFPFLIGD